MFVFHSSSIAGAAEPEPIFCFAEARAELFLLSFPSLRFVLIGKTVSV